MMTTAHFKVPLGKSMSQIGGLHLIRYLNDAYVIYTLED